MREYDRIAAWYVATRDPEVGVPDLTAFMQTLSPRAAVLDLGCGDGVPVSRLLTEAGFRVVALDSSPEMVARYRANFADVPIRCERVQESDFAAESFDAVVAWGVLFHLSGTEQAEVIQKVAGWLRPGGRLLFTSGDAEGTVESEMSGVTFRYVSLGVSGYRRALEDAGVHLETHHRDAWDNHVYIARKAA